MNANVVASLVFDITKTGWHFDGDFNGCPATTRLSTLCELTIGSQDVSMRIELYEVAAAGDLTAVNPELQEDVDRVCALCGDVTVQTILVSGRSYVPVLVPFGD